MTLSGVLYKIRTEGGGTDHAGSHSIGLFLRPGIGGIYLFQNLPPVDYGSEIQARFHGRQAALRYADGLHEPVRQERLA